MEDTPYRVTSDEDIETRVPTGLGLQPPVVLSAQSTASARTNDEVSLEREHIPTDFSSVEIDTTSRSVGESEALKTSLTGGTRGDARSLLESEISAETQKTALFLPMTELNELRTLARILQGRELPRVAAGTFEAGSVEPAPAPAVAPAESSKGGEAAIINNTTATTTTYDHDENNADEERVLDAFLSALAQPQAPQASSLTVTTPSSTGSTNTISCVELLRFSNFQAKMMAKLQKLEQQDQHGEGEAGDMRPATGGFGAATERLQDSLVEN